MLQLNQTKTRQPPKTTTPEDNQSMIESAWKKKRGTILGFYSI